MHILLYTGIHPTQTAAFAKHLTCVAGSILSLQHYVVVQKMAFPSFHIWWTISALIVYIRAKFRQ